MKKNKFFLLCIFVPAFAFQSDAQDSIVYKLNQYFRKIENTDYTYRRVIKKINDSAWEQFDYLRFGNPYQQTFFKDKELKIQHGQYTLFDSKGKASVTGTYENNRPAYTWYFYNTGKDRLTDSIDYRFYSTLGTRYTGQLPAPDSILFNSAADQEAVFPGGEKAWKKFLTKNFEDFANDFPEAAHKEIHISFMIDKTGKLINVYPVKSIDPFVDFAVIQRIRNSPGWKPAEQRGKKKIAIRMQSLHF
jgi:hypothetical protein